MKLTIDFETYSAVNIKTDGAASYAEHPSTGVFCLSVKVDDEPLRLWVAPDFRHALPGHSMADDELVTLIAQADEIEAHNAQFEELIWQHVMHARMGFPTLPLDKLRCSAANCARHALPRHLGGVAAALGVDAQKDKRGGYLISTLSVPAAPKAAEWKELESRFAGSAHFVQAREAYKAASSQKKWEYLGVIAGAWEEIILSGYDPNDMLVWNRDPGLLREMFAYCLQDAEAEHCVSQALAPMPASSVAIWQLDQTINRRGMYIDVQGAKNAIAVAEDWTCRLLAEMDRLTSGQVTTPNQTERIIKWCASRGVDLPNNQKATVAHYLEQDIPADVRRLLEIKESIGKASVKKYYAILRLVSSDNRARGCYLWHGAATGRWAGRGFQPQNLPRGSVKLDSDESMAAAYEAFRQGVEIVEAVYGDPMDLVTSAIRGVVMAAPGHVLYSSDFSSVEARVLAWMAEEEQALNVFRSGLDPYKVAACSIFGAKYEGVKADQRQVGKTSELALGYGGGIGAYAAMARNYGIDLETLPAFVFPAAQANETISARSTAERYLENLEHRIKHGIGKASPLDRMSLDAAMACDIIKQKWRASRPATVGLWGQLEAAAMAAIMQPGSTHQAGPVLYGVRGEFLLCRLPSGRKLRYYKPEVRMREKFGSKQPTITFMGVKQTDTGGAKYQRLQTYGGRLCENVDQAISADLQSEAMLRVNAHGYPPVMHTHDELTAEVVEGFGDMQEYDGLMAVVPEWAKGLPMGAKGWRGYRYRKD